MSRSLSSSVDSFNDVSTNCSHVDIGANRDIAVRAFENEAVPSLQRERNRTHHRFKGELIESLLAVRTGGHDSLPQDGKGILA